MDDEVQTLFSFGAGEQVEEGFEMSGESAGLQHEVESAQRLCVMRNAASYTRGSMELCSVNGRSATAEKYFSAPGLYQWTGGKPESLIAALKVKRVRARLQARMGLGKSTRLPHLLAEELQARVLVVSLNAHALRQASEYSRAVGIGRVRRQWARTREARVNCMTYHDFNGHMMGRRPADLFQSFELIIFDEAFEATAAVFCAQRAFAVYATADVSLLLCSATIDEAASDVGSGAATAGVFRVVKEKTVKEMIAAGTMVTSYLTDRSYVVLPTDAEVAEVRDHYADYGVEVYALDSAGSYGEFTDILHALRGDAVTPRVVVMHSSWAIEFNVGVEFGIIRPFRAAWVEVASVWVEDQQPMTDQLVAQAKSRSGRGIADTSSGVVVGEKRAPAVQLYSSDVLEAFVTMFAMNIRPNKTAFWERCWAAFPGGLPASTAHLLLKVNLPVAIVAKFLGPDGCIASKYARALSMFTQTDHYICPSTAEDPVGIEEWLVEDWVDLGLGVESHALVPCRSTGEVQCILHGIAAVVRGELRLERWRSDELTPAIGDYDSDSGVVQSSRTHLRRVEARPKLPVGAQEVPPASGYRVTAAVPDAPHLPVIYTKERMRSALQALEATLQYGEHVLPEFTPVETTAGTVVRLPLVSDAAPDAPKVCELPAGLVASMQRGKDLGVADTVSLVKAVSGVEQEVVGSALFDAQDRPWLSVLRAVPRTEVYDAICAAGKEATAIRMLMAMRRRFDYEVHNVLAQSSVTRAAHVRHFPHGAKRGDVLEAMRFGAYDLPGRSVTFFNHLRLVDKALFEALAAAGRRGAYLAGLPRVAASVTSSQSDRGQSGWSGGGLHVRGSMQDPGPGRVAFRPGGPSLAALLAERRASSGY